MRIMMAGLTIMRPAIFLFIFFGYKFYNIEILTKALDYGSSFDILRAY